jgi:hypothetical protein
MSDIVGTRWCKHGCEREALDAEILALRERVAVLDELQRQLEHDRANASASVAWIAAQYLEVLKGTTNG